MGAKSRKCSSHAVTRRKSSHVSSLAPDKQTCEVRRIRIDPRETSVLLIEKETIRSNNAHSISFEEAWMAGRQILASHPDPGRICESLYSKVTYVEKQTLNNSRDELYKKRKPDIF